MSTVIVGAGVTGLTVALQHLRAGKKILILEREPVVGGLCRSYQYGPFSFDVGPHRLYAADPGIDSFFLSILGENQVETPRISQVNLNGTFHNWPLGISSLSKLSPLMLLGCLSDLLTSGKNYGEIATLKDFVLSRYGKTIYKIFWEDYTEKFLGIPCNKVAAEWGQLSVNRSVINEEKRPSGLMDLLRQLLARETSPLLFRYPTGGMGDFPNAMAAMVRELGGEIRLNQNITGIKQSDGNITGIQTQDEHHPVDKLVWTGSLIEVSSLLDQPAPELEYLDIALLNLEIEGELKGDWQWVYFPDKRHVFSRISRPSAFHPNMTPKGATGLCVEVTLPPESPYHPHDESLQARVYDDLVDTRLLKSKDQVVNCHHELVKSAYPIYKKGYRSQVDSAQAALKVVNNLQLAGRMALFEHDNIDEAVKFALDLPVQELPA